MKRGRADPCIVCKIPRVDTGRVDKVGLRIYATPEGVNWERRAKCPKCAREKSYKKLNSTHMRRLCRKCKKVLRPDRYFNCKDCVVLPSEDVWFEACESFTPNEIMQISVRKDQPSTRDRDRGKKKCARCEITKSRALFHVSSMPTGDPHRPYCKDCTNAERKRYKSLARQKAFGQSAAPDASTLV